MHAPAAVFATSCPAPRPAPLACVTSTLRLTGFRLTDWEPVFHGEESSGDSTHKYLEDNTAKSEDCELHSWTSARQGLGGFVTRRAGSISTTGWLAGRWVDSNYTRWPGRQDERGIIGSSDNGWSSIRIAIDTRLQCSLDHTTSSAAASWRPAANPCCCSLTSLRTRAV